MGHRGTVLLLNFVTVESWGTSWDGVALEFRDCGDRGGHRWTVLLLNFVTLGSCGTSWEGVALDLRDCGIVGDIVGRCSSLTSCLWDRVGHRGTVLLLNFVTVGSCGTSWDGVAL